MVNKPTKNDLEFFYDGYEHKDPFLILLKVIFSLGIYIFVWIYNMNFKLQEIDKDAPMSSRGAIILILIPIFLIFLDFMLEYVIKLNINVIIIINVLLWSLFIFLSLKYLYDFCECFGKWTFSKGILWYLSIYPGYFSVVLAFFDFYYTLPLLFFTIVSIPSMQAYLNIKEEKFREKLEHSTFNVKVKAE